MRVFLVEDESLLAMVVEGMLEDLGYEVAGTADNVDKALEEAQTGDFDCALLDVNLRGKTVYPVAEILSDRGVPFIFASGYGGAGLPQRFKDRPVVAKPFQLEDLSAALSDVVQARSAISSE